jgi:serine/threonine protein kinase
VGVHVLVAERYRLEEPLGQGAMGEVWRATDHTLGRPVAVKLLRADAAGSDRIDRFRREACFAARLNHPHVVAVYDFGSHCDQHFLVMELVDGWTLRQELAAYGTLRPQDAAALGVQMAQGLSAAHHEGVIHRDIKPANVMVTAERIVKITDFGIARFADEAPSTLTAAGKILGTGDYLAPERALGHPAGPASDVYSLGCTLYHLLTGRPPFLGATTLDVVQQQVNSAPVPPTRLRPAIPTPLADCVMELLAKNPTRRPSAQQTAARLAELHRPRDAQPDAAASPVGAAPSRQPTPAWPATVRTARSRSRERRKAVLGAGTVVLFGVAATLGASLNSSGDAPSGSPARTATDSPTPAGPAHRSGDTSTGRSPERTSPAPPSAAPAPEQSSGKQSPGKRK